MPLAVVLAFIFWLANCRVMRSPGVAVPQMWTGFSHCITMLEDMMGDVDSWEYPWAVCIMRSATMAMSLRVWLIDVFIVSGSFFLSGGYFTLMMVVRGFRPLALALTVILPGAALERTMSWHLPW